jgi:hypothetical protein
MEWMTRALMLAALLAATATGAQKAAVTTTQRGQIVAAGGTKLTTSVPFINESLWGANNGARDNFR